MLSWTAGFLALVAHIGLLRRKILTAGKTGKAL